MALVINARFLTQPLSGVQRYARELVTALDRRLTADPGLQARIGPVTALHPVAPLSDPPRWTHITTAPLPGLSGHLWEQVTLARAARHTLLLSLGGSGPIMRGRQIVIIHDANIWDIAPAFSRGYRLFHGTMRPLLARRTGRIATVSLTAARALAPRLGCAAADITVIPNSAEHILSVPPDPGILHRFGLLPGGFFLTVGNQSPNKNIARLVQAHAADPGFPPLAIAGGFAPGLAQTTMTAGQGVHLLGRVTDGELRALYMQARAFLWPSRHEGFGIPPLEAMTLGTPVLSSNTSAMPEVLGDAALYVDPDDPADITRALHHFLTRDPAAMIAAGHARAACFTWDHSAARLADMISAAMA